MSMVFLQVICLYFGFLKNLKLETKVPLKILRGLEEKNS